MFSKWLLALFALVPVEALPGRAGFVNVNPSANSSMFYWYFPAQSGNPTAPLILWLQGGPGSSGLLGLFKELGPLQIDSSGQVQPRSETWNKEYGLLFVDNPVGTGFSSTASDSGYARDQTDVARDLYMMLQGFFAKQPDQARVPFYVAGESYGGHHVPSLCSYILQQQRSARLPSGHVKVQLSGLAIGDGLTDPPMQVLAKPSQAQAFGLVNAVERAMLDEWAQNASKLARGGEFSLAFEWRSRIEDYVKVHSGVTVYDVRRMGDYDFSDVDRWANDADNKAALGIASTVSYRTDAAVKAHLRDDEMKSYKHLFPELLNPANKLRILLYQGQFDWKDGTSSNQAWINSIDWEGHQEFANAPRSIWHGSDGSIAGYVQAARNLCEVVVAGAGHLVPMDQPRHSHDMIHGFISGTLCHNDERIEV